MGISFITKGDTHNMERFLNNIKKLRWESTLTRAAEAGVKALEAATPIDSGLAARSWTYDIERGRGGYTIVWKNTDVESGFPVALMIQYGHGTGTGGYVQGRDYVNPAMRPIFDQLAEDVWKAVRSA